MPRARKRVSRRALLRAAALGGSGLLAASVLGCADGDDGRPTATATAGAPSSPTPGSTSTADPASLTLRWRPLSSPPHRQPPPRRDHSLVSDHRNLYLFGGRNPGPLGDLWMYSLVRSAWFELTTEGGPPARFGHNAMWDWSSNRMIVFGGQGDSGFLDDLWAFDPETRQWTDLAGNGGRPAPRYGAGATLGFGLASFGSPADRLLVTHGFASGGRFDDTWQYGLGGEGWTEITPQGGPRPIERCLMRTVWDTAGERLLLFGGQTTGSPFLGDLWELREQGWSEISAEPGPSPRTLYGMIFDEDRDYLALFGGNTAQGPANDLWLFDSATNAWSQPPFEGEAPSPRFGHDMAWLRGGAALFGGRDETGDLNDLWSLA